MWFQLHRTKKLEEVIQMVEVFYLLNCKICDKNLFWLDTRSKKIPMSSSSSTFGVESTLTAYLHIALACTHRRWWRLTSGWRLTPSSTTCNTGSKRAENESKVTLPDWRRNVGPTWGLFKPFLRVQIWGPFWPRTSV